MTLTGCAQKQKPRIHYEFEVLVFLIDTQPNFAKATSGDAEEEGFEPPEPCGSTVFKTAAFDRSATPL